MKTSLLLAEAANQANIYQDIFNRPKTYFDSHITKSFEWRLDQLNRLARLLSEHTDEFYEALSRDFKTALSEKVFEVAASCLERLRERYHKKRGIKGANKKRNHVS